MAGDTFYWTQNKTRLAFNCTCRVPFILGRLLLLLMMNCYDSLTFNIIIFYLYYYCYYYYHHHHHRLSSLLSSLSLSPKSIREIVDSSRYETPSSADATLYLVCFEMWSRFERKLMLKRKFVVPSSDKWGYRQHVKIKLQKGTVLKKKPLNIFNPNTET